MARRRLRHRLPAGGDPRRTRSRQLAARLHRDARDPRLAAVHARLRAGLRRRCAAAAGDRAVGSRAAGHRGRAQADRVGAARLRQAAAARRASAGHVAARPRSRLRSTRRSAARPSSSSRPRRTWTRAWPSCARRWRAGAWTKRCATAPRSWRVRRSREIDDPRPRARSAAAGRRPRVPDRRGGAHQRAPPRRRDDHRDQLRGCATARCASPCATTAAGSPRTAAPARADCWRWRTALPRSARGWPSPRPSAANGTLVELDIPLDHNGGTR